MRSPPPRAYAPMRTRSCTRSGTSPRTRTGSRRRSPRPCARTARTRSWRRSSHARKPWISWSRTPWQPRCPGRKSLARRRSERRSKPARRRTKKERNRNELLRSAGSDPLRDRAEPAQRAGDGHLLAPLEGPHHLSGDAGGRPGGERHHGAASAPGERGPRAGHKPVHQLAGRQRLGRARHLRHHSVRQAGHRHDGPRNGGLAGQASDVEIHAKELIATKRRLNEILAEHTGQPYERIERDTDRDYIMGPDEAIEYGLIDTIIKNH